MPSTINQYFAADHDRLDALFAFVFNSYQATPDRALEAFKVFHQGLIIHIAWEEQVLFPVFEAATGMSGGPTHVMRIEHERIKRLCDDALTAFADANEQLTDSLQQLQAMLEEHNYKEEHILYPAIDSLLDEQALANVFVSMAKVADQSAQAAA